MSIEGFCSEILVVLGSLLPQANSHLKYWSLNASYVSSLILARFKFSEYFAVFELGPQNRIACGS